MPRARENLFPRLDDQLAAEIIRWAVSHGRSEFIDPTPYIDATNRTLSELSAAHLTLYTAYARRFLALAESFRPENATETVWLPLDIGFSQDTQEIVTFRLQYQKNTEDTILIGYDALAKGEWPNYQTNARFVVEINPTQLLASLPTDNLGDESSIRHRDQVYEQTEKSILTAMAIYRVLNIIWKYNNIDQITVFQEIMAWQKNNFAESDGENSSLMLHIQQWLTQFAATKERLSQETTR